MDANLQEAARKGDVGVFQELSARGGLTSLLEKRDDDGRTLLHLAAASGSLPLVQLLGQQGGGGAQLANVSDEEGWTPLHSATSCGNTEVAEYLLQQLGANVDARNTGGRTALHYAASKGKVDLVNLLLQRGGDVNAKDQTGSSALHRAAGAGKTEALRALLDGRAKVDSRDGKGSTPLLIALECQNNGCAMLLAKAGADLEAVNKEGQSALSYTSPEVLKALQAAAAGQEDMEL